MPDKTENLNHLITRTQQAGPGNGKGILAGILSKGLFLSNAASVKVFDAICSSGELIPQADLQSDEPTDEQRLGTDTAVFFYLAPFSYPQTQCGLLFKQEMGNAYTENSDATPFDSGALCDIFSLPNGETPERFLSNHLLPVPGNEALLEAEMVHLFSEPGDYVLGNDPIHQGPVTLTGGDHRRWTHEVRIHSRIPVENPIFLEAVFILRNRATNPGIERFLTYCRRNDIMRIYLNAPHDMAFDEMRQRCITHIETELGVSL